ncbi:MAG: zinc-binding dehydrogenase [Caldilineaceae bacterium SB0665_bin_21]|nr:zinc-binding dehydrogenase [Caldilineaceae bacterium SB0665_bin_21]MYA04898.1 zinc-binding dehydrogenase [Caldilineaceae bacterium SB0664_bin_22]MYC63883.1 zinc-binding dehydrogenase [Caldilineaceae bacterium SB0661_bin_34]
MKAKAIVFPAANTVEVREVDCPEPGPSDVVVEVTHSWISNGTEGSYLRGERIAGDTAWRPGSPNPFPVVAGYQKVGIVREVGSHVTDLAPGEMVFAASSKVNGMFHPSGGQLSPSVTPREGVWKLPLQPQPLAYAGMVLTQVGYNCGSRAPVAPGEAAVVLGDGMVGLWAAQTLALRGARILLLGRHENRMQHFPENGLHLCCNERDGDWQKALIGFLSDGVDVLVDTVGSIEHIQAILPRMNRDGRIVSAGFHGTDDLLSLQDLRNGELSLHSVSGWTRPRMDRTRHLISTGQLQTLPLITHRFPVDRAAEAWDLIRTKREPVLGVILDWTVSG